MITLKSLGKFVVIALVAYAILLGFFSGLGMDKVYKNALMKTMKTMHSTYTNDGLVKYGYETGKSKAAEQTEYMLVTVTSKKVTEMMKQQAEEMNRKAGYQKIKKLDVPQARFRMEIWEFSLVPMILLLVLIIATPITLARKARAIIIAMILYHLFLWFKYWVKLTVEVNRHEWMELISLSNFWESFYLYANTYLYFIGTSLALVIIIWIISCFNKQDFDKLSESITAIGE